VSGVVCVVCPCADDEKLKNIHVDLVLLHKLGLINKLKLRAERDKGVCLSVLDQVEVDERKSIRFVFQYNKDVLLSLHLGTSSIESACKEYNIDRREHCPYTIYMSVYIYMYANIYVYIYTYI